MKFGGDKTDVTALVRYAQSLEAENERLRERVASLQASSGYEASIAQVQIERLRAFIQSLDGKHVGARAEENTFLDEMVIVADDVLGVNQQTTK